MRSGRRSAPASRSSAEAPRRTTRARKPTAASSLRVRRGRAHGRRPGHPPVRRPAGVLVRRRDRLARRRSAGDDHPDLRCRRARDRRAARAGVLRAVRRHGPPPVANPLAVFEEPGSDRFYLRTPWRTTANAGRSTFFGAVPEGATVQLTMAGTDQIFEGTKASIADALARLPGRRPARRRPPLLLRDAQVPAGDARRSRDRDRTRSPGAGAADRRALLHGGDRADGLGRRDAVPQRDDGLGPARVRIGGRGRVRLDDRASRLGLAGRAGEGEPPAHPAPPAPRGQRPPARGVPGLELDARVSVCSPSSRRSARDRSGCCSTCCRSGSSTGWRPGRR